MHKQTLLIKNARIVNEGTIFEGDVLIEDQIIKEISSSISVKNSNVTVIDAENNYLIPRVYRNSRKIWLFYTLGTYFSIDLKMKLNSSSGGVSVNILAICFLSNQPQRF